MRVIAGSAKGREIKTAISGVRPVAARVKKSVFDRLGDLAGIEVLDVFAGSGALGIECLSRGAERAVFIEKNPHAADIISGNIKQCGFENRHKVIRSDFRKAAKRLTGAEEKFDLIFIAPPYSFYKTVSRKKLTELFVPLLSESGRIVIEYETEKNFGRSAGGDQNCRTKKYGGTTVSILALKNQTPARKEK